MKRPNSWWKTQADKRKPIVLDRSSPIYTPPRSTEPPRGSGKGRHEWGRRVSRIRGRSAS